MIEHPFVADWSDVDFFQLSPLVLPADRPILSEEEEHFCNYRSFEEFAASPELDAKVDRKIHLGLVPVPFVGSLATSRVFILMLNPGLNPGDYATEENRGFRSALVENLGQQEKQAEYPFLFLDPKWAWAHGSGYWTNKLRDVIDVVQHRCQLNYRDALSYVSQRISVLQYLPYHSRDYKLPSRIDSNLPSCQNAVSYVNELLLPRARQGEIGIVVARSAKKWGIENYEDGVVVYRGSEARSASLSLKNRGGGLMLDMLLRDN